MGFRASRLPRHLIGELVLSLHRLRATDGAPVFGAWRRRVRPAVPASTKLVMGLMPPGTGYRTALGLATDTGNRLQQARAHRGIARALHETTRHAEAAAHWHQALDLFTDLGVTDAGELRLELASLDDICRG